MPVDIHPDDYEDAAMTIDYAGIYWAGSFPRDGHGPASEGSDAAAPSAAALADVVDWTGGDVVDLTGGELRPLQTDWARPICDVITDALGLPALEPGRGGKYTDYLGRMLNGVRYRRRINARIAAGHLPHLPYAEWARQDHADYDDVQAATGSTARFLVGIPSPLAMRMFSGVLWGHAEAFEERVATQIREILAEHPDTVIQFELPVEIGMASFGRVVMPRPLLRRLVRRLLAPFERLIAAAPAGARFSFHLCYGDLGHKPFVPKALQSPVVMVELINAILGMDAWSARGTDGPRLFAIHDPWADGQNVLDQGSRLAGRARAYRRVGAFGDPDTIYAAGGLGANLSVDDVEEFARLVGSLFEGKAGRIALATPCGNGRSPIDDVRQTYRHGHQALRKLRDAGSR